MNMIVVELGVILLLFVANGVFAMTEMAMVSSRKSQLRLLADGGNRGALTALKLADEPNRFLPAVQVGITLVGLLAGAFGGATIAEEIARGLAPFPELAPYAEAIGVGAVVLALTFFSLVIGELVPKRLALSNPERIAGLMARPLDWTGRAARPVIWLLGIATDAVLFVLRVKPKTQATISEDEVKLLMREGSQVGVPNVADLMVAPLFVNASRTVASLLETFKASGKHIGIVVDERNDFLGVVTLVDVLEAIVGELPSLEERLRPEARQRSDGSWLVDGAVARTPGR